MTLLANQFILLLKVDNFVAGYVGAALITAGARLIGPVADVVEARALVTRDPRVDAAVLGLTQGTADEWAFCGDLADRGILVAFTSSGPIDLPLRWREAPHLRKVFAAYQVVDAIRQVLLSKTIEADKSRGL